MYICLPASLSACRAAASVLIFVDSGIDASLQQRLLDDSLLDVITHEHLFQVTLH